MKRAGDTRAVRSRGGFTILELLVVIFIMMAMTGIAVAAFKQFLDTERIKLAGGQVVSALRMGRQYAMSRRTKVMVEFISPSYGIKEVTTMVASSEAVRVRAGSYTNTNYNGQNAVFKWVNGGDSYDRRGLLKFDVSGVAGTIIQATLVLNVSTWNSNDNINLDVKSIADDTWSQTTVKWSTQPAAGAVLDSCTVTSTQEYRLNVSIFVAAEQAGDKTVSLALWPGSGANGADVNSATLEIAAEVDTGETGESVSHVPRTVRIIPYLRMRDTVTGGFSWLLDQDSGSLKTMELPPNIHYVLTPKKIAIDQYDPGDVVDQKSTVKKVFFDLLPDGTCTAQPPDVEGWTTRVNTVILHDAMTDDLALLFVPPSSSFTRQRYLFGDEVGAFIAANSLYSLW